MGLDEALLNTLSRGSKIMDDNVHEKFRFRVFCLQVLDAV